MRSSSREAWELRRARVVYEFGAAHRNRQLVAPPFLDKVLGFSTSGDEWRRRAGNRETGGDGVTGADDTA